jgi:hypothetical protein
MSLHEEEYKGYKIDIVYDDDPVNPRDYNAVGRMVCFHKRYNLGDPHDLNSRDFESWSDVEGYIVKKMNAKIILPLYLYDHSGLHLKVGSFRGMLPQGHAEFDSCQVGFIYCTPEDIRRNFDIKRITKKQISKVERFLTAEVEEYAAYLNGSVYGYYITAGDDTEDDFTDSACGFIGDYEEAIKAAKDVIDGIVLIEQAEGEMDTEPLFVDQTGGE